MPMSEIMTQVTPDSKIDQGPIVALMGDGAGVTPHNVQPMIADDDVPSLESDPIPAQPATISPAPSPSPLPAYGASFKVGYGPTLNGYAVPLVDENFTEAWTDDGDKFMKRDCWIFKVLSGKKKCMGN